ncbi:hypothetical protein DM01DRAFT_1277790, partial [Hesseltinella vesiculosa]
NLDRWLHPRCSSELTFFRKFVPILEFLFVSTVITLSDGEHASLATKDIIELNMALFSTNDSPVTYGRKIDLIIVLDGKEPVELSTNEWKGDGVQSDMTTKQQVKNLLCNAATLERL